MIEQPVETRADTVRAGERRAAAGVENDTTSAVAPVEAVVRRNTTSAPGGTGELERELYRSRRYGRTLGLVGQPLRSVEQVSRLWAVLRAGDYVWSDGGTVYILAPECGREAVDGLIARVGTLDPSALDPDAARAAVFPEDALTSDALLAAVTVPATERAGEPDAPAEEPALLTRLLKRVRGTSRAPEFGDTSLSL